MIIYDEKYKIVGLIFEILKFYIFNKCLIIIIEFDIIAINNAFKIL